MKARQLRDRKVELGMADAEHPDWIKSQFVQIRDRQGRTYQRVELLKDYLDENGHRQTFKVHLSVEEARQFSELLALLLEETKGGLF